MDEIISDPRGQEYGAYHCKAKKNGGMAVQHVRAGKVTFNMSFAKGKDFSAWKTATL